MEEQCVCIGVLLWELEGSDSNTFALQQCGRRLCDLWSRGWEEAEVSECAVRGSDQAGVSSEANECDECVGGCGRYGWRWSGRCVDMQPGVLELLDV